MHLRTPRALAAAAALALAVGACSDVPTAAPARIAGAHVPAGSAHTSGPQLIPNSVKYRDLGGKPATGRSGTAVLSAYALLDKQGTTEVSLSASSSDSAKVGIPGVLKLVQIRAQDPNGKHMFTRTLHDLGTFTPPLTFNTLAPGSQLQVQANVTGLDGSRTDVVTVIDRVKRLPDLAVWLEMPAQVPTLQPVPIMATVAELNGDVGGYAECRLKVDGWVRDEAPGIWVDAGDAVTCAFAHSFTPGMHDVQVEVHTAFSREWDPANNLSQVVRVAAVGGPTEFRYQAYASAQRWRDRLTIDTRWYYTEAQLRGESRTDELREGDTEYAFMSGDIPWALGGNVLFEVSQSTDGRVVHSDVWTEAVHGCTRRVDGTFNFYICAHDYGGEGYTWFTYTHVSSSVTYHSSEYYREWDERTGEDLWYYHRNSSSSDDDNSNVDFGGDYAFHVRVSSGDAVLTADPHFVLQYTSWPFNGTFCDGWTDDWNGVTRESCTTFDWLLEERAGEQSSGW